MAFGLGDGGANVRHPRCWLKLGEARVPCISADVRRSAKRGSDTFQAILSIQRTQAIGYGLAEWTDFQPVDAALIFATTGADERVMMTGQIDEPRVRLLDMTVSVSGRDKSASLNEGRRREKFNNQKTKDIVEKIAKAHKLKPQVRLPGSQSYAGKIYDQDTALLAVNRTDFEMLSDLAEREGCRWFVDGDSLHFEPQDQPTGTYSVVWSPPETVNAYTTANVLDVHLSRNMSAARPHTVRTKAWHHRQRKLFTAESTMPGIGSAIEYEDHHSGRTQEQLETLSKARIADASRHELSVDIEAPGDLSVDVRQKLTLSGTGTIYDQDYDIEDVAWDISWGRGFGMRLRAIGAKAGRDAKTTGRSKGGKSANENGPATKTMPLPPQRPPNLGTIAT